MEGEWSEGGNRELNKSVRARDAEAASTKQEPYTIGIADPIAAESGGREFGALVRTHTLSGTDHSHRRGRAAHGKEPHADTGGSTAAVLGTNATGGYRGGMSDSAGRPRA